MRKIAFLALGLSPLLLASACATAPGGATAPFDHQTPITVGAASTYPLAAQRAKIARIAMTPDVSFLTAEDRQVVNLLNEAANLMSVIYQRQVSEQNPALRAEIAASNRPDRDALLDMFDLHFGVWDSLAEYAPFYGDTPLPPGRALYPADLTKAEFDAWLAAHPDQREAMLGLYTVVRRDGDGFRAIPYSQYYREWLEPAAQKLEQAAAITSNASLKRFLTLRAKAFRTDDYFESDMAWMDLEGPIEVVIGPYEVYTDTLYGAKAAFEAYVTVMNPAESAALDKYKGYLRDMEANLPVEDRYKNFQRGSDSPIAVAEQVHGGGDNVPGVQTVAFNLPNDERVREAKGAKKVILSNVLEAKYTRILQPMAALTLVPEQAGLVSKKYMTMETLFHELAHSLGPGSITIDGRATTVNAELKDLYSASEEGKADVMGVWNLMFMMEKGEIPAAETSEMFATYLAGLFRAMRFGIDEAHGRGAAMQYGYLKDKGAFAWDAAAGRYRVDDARMAAGVRDLVRDLVVLQGDGDYDGMKAFFDRHARLDAHAETVIASMSAIPVDIQPIYPERL